MIGLALERYQELVDRLNGYLEELHEKKEAEIRKKEDDMQEERFKRRREKELNIEEIKLEMKKKNEEKDMILNRNIQVKLPKLVTTKFEGTHLNWFWFWNQFETEIGKVEISAISTFSYLREFLIPKVRALIVGLSFKPEEYETAKSILLAKFGKPSEVAAVHMQCINSLPVVSNSNLNKMHEFYEKLIVTVQGLNTIHKLSDIRGYY